MTRIIAGTAKGHRLQVPRTGTRPTADRVREAMFSSITSWLSARSRTWSQVAVLDLFAGSGALGLEAASRGAALAVLVERSERAAALIRRNAAACRLEQVRVLAASATALPARRIDLPAYDLPPFDLCLADPPYDLPALRLRAALGSIAADWLLPDAMLVVERPTGESDCPLPDQWAVIDQRRYGDTCLWYGHRQAG